MTFVGLAFVSVGACTDDELSSTSQGLTSTQMVEPIRNDAGRARTVTPSGSIDTASAFFQELGNNGRTCESCHRAQAGWSITPAFLRVAFDTTDGTDSVFRPFDAADYPAAPVDTVEQRERAYSRMLARGVIRVQLPANAAHRQFRLVNVTKPAGEPENAGYPAGTLSVFRRPLPTSNLRFATSVNWDGRNSTAAFQTIRAGLLAQANGATLNHAWLPAPGFVALPAETRDSIVNQELALHFAQVRHDDVGNLDSSGAKGGANALLAQSFEIGATNPGHTFDIFDAWAEANSDRRRVARGQDVFNAKCAGCHSAPNIGTSATQVFFDVKVSDPARVGDPANWQADVPLFTFERLVSSTTGETTTFGDPNAVGSGERIQTTDPGRALISGAWADMNKFKVPVLRGLAARPPYFHDGSAATVEDVVRHYESALGIALTRDEQRDLIWFLESL